MTATHPVFHVVSAMLKGLATVAAVLSLSVVSPPAQAAPLDVVAKHTPGSKTTIDHSAWDKLLKTYVEPGSDGLNRVDYATFKARGHADLKNYIARIQTVDLKTLDRPEQFALLANLYNAKTIDIVLDKYPVKSIKDISLGGGFIASIKGGPWKAEVLNLGGTRLSLDDIEHGILRPAFKDPRVHYAVNCASVGCPNLQTEAFTGARLGEQLDAGARAYINHPRGVTITADGVVVSSIYSWFKEDFGGNDAGVLKHLARYASPALAAKLKSASALAGHTYDWSLNRASK